MGKKFSKSKKSESSKKPDSSKKQESSKEKGKRYIDDPVLGRMVYNEVVGAFVPAANQDKYEESFSQYYKEKEKNKKKLKIFNIPSEDFSNFYTDTSEHKNLSIIKSIPVNLDIYNFIYFLKDGKLAVNTGKILNIYNQDFETIEQTINAESQFITQLKDNSLVNCNYDGANIYKEDSEKKQFIFNCCIKCLNGVEKVVELQNGQLAINGGRGIQIFVKDKEKGNYIEEGKNIMITTIEDYIQINENELASISGQESEITFWDLTTREIITQIGEIKNYGRFCLILYDKSLIVGGADRYTDNNFIYIINVESHELIKKYNFFGNIWFMNKFNGNEFFSGDSRGFIKRYRYEENIIKIMEENNEHKDTVLKLASEGNNNYFASLSDHLLVIFKISE